MGRKKGSWAPAMIMGGVGGGIALCGLVLTPIFPPAGLAVAGVGGIIAGIGVASSVHSKVSARREEQKERKAAEKEAKEHENGKERGHEQEKGHERETQLERDLGVKRPDLQSDKAHDAYDTVVDCKRNMLNHDKARNAHANNARAWDHHEQSCLLRGDMQGAYHAHQNANWCKHNAHLADQAYKQAEQGAHEWLNYASKLEAEHKAQGEEKNADKDVQQEGNINDKQQNNSEKKTSEEVSNEKSNTSSTEQKQESQSNAEIKNCINSQEFSAAQQGLRDNAQMDGKGDVQSHENISAPSVSGSSQSNDQDMQI